MRRALFVFLAWLSVANGAPAQPVIVEVPSGQPVEFHDVVRDARGSRGLTWRFRFIAPEIDRVTGSVSSDIAAEDMEYLCQNFAVDRLPNLGPRPSQVVISMSSKPIKFGSSDPQITQFFEAYAIEDNDCIWEAF